MFPSRSLILVLLFGCKLLDDEDTGIPGARKGSGGAEPIAEVTRAKGPVVPVELPSGTPIEKQCSGYREDGGGLKRRTAGGPTLSSKSAPSVGGGATTSSPPRASRRPTSVTPAPVAPENPPADATAGRQAAEPAAKKPSAPKVEDVGRAEEAKGDSYDRDKMEKEVSRPADDGVDWGALVYLSNDDSMSLASAQRLLWAVKAGAPFKTSEVRPHELLNYFHFETTAPTGANLFGVQGVGEETTPGTFSVALAVQGATPPRRPLDLTVVVDRSGSMAAEGRMDFTKRGLSRMSESLVHGDRVNLVFFDHEVCTPLENFVVGRDDPSVLTRAIGQLAPRGSTNLNAGLEEGYRIALSQADSDARNHRVLMITDALVNEGQIDPNRISEVGKAYDDKGIRLAAVGVGREFSDDVLDLLTEKGKGAYVYLGSEVVVDRVFGEGFDSLTQTIAHDVHFALDLPPGLAMERFYGEEASTVKEDVQPIHYYAGTSQVFLQDLKVRGRLDPRERITLSIEYTNAETGAKNTETWGTTVGDLLAGDRSNLDKAQALMAWSDVLLARSMGGDACGSELKAYEARIADVRGDAEIEYVSGLTGGLCGVELHTGPSNVAFKVKLDSDLPITKLIAECSGTKTERSLTSGQSTAMLDLQPGSCSLELMAGDMSSRAQVTVPEVGGEVRCTIRKGRVSCG